MPSMWDERYSQPGYAFGTQPNEFLQDHFSRIPPGGRVLCLGEGEGRNGVFLAEQGYEVTGVDLSAVGLKKAQALAAERKVEIKTVVADLADFAPGVDAWDGVVSIAVHLPPDVRKALLARIVASLRSGGVFILEGYTEKQLEMPGKGGPSAEHRELFLSLEAVRGEIAGLDVLIGREIERIMGEGDHHDGESAVLQLVAQKP
ncbi:MAG: class I SAM-dependent methyltransferase [Lysobacterales bacterium]